MADRALILSADHYSIPDEKTGVVNDLFQVWYVNDYRDDTETEIGCKPIKMLTTPEIFAQLRQQELPAMFDLELRSRPGKANAAALTVVGMAYVSTPKLFPVAPQPALAKPADKHVSAPAA
jgi:hypothetical protein